MLPIIVRPLWREILLGLALVACALGIPARAPGIPPYPPGDFAEQFKTSAELTAALDVIAAHQSTTRTSPLHFTGVFNVPVLLIDFDDHEADTLRYPPSHYESLVFDPTAGVRSLHTYYLENSYGTFVVRGTVTPWMRSQYSYNSYYVNADRVTGNADDHGFDVAASAAVGTEHPRNVWGLVKEAVEMADAYLDFSQFDNDADGTIDALIVVHAGCGAEFQSCRPSADQIWSHQSALGDYLEVRAPQLWPVVVDGRIADIYTLNPEDGEMGVFCHEFGHTLGLPDFYNTSSLESRLGRFCLMDYGGWSGWPVGTSPSHLSSWCKSYLGWLDPLAIDSTTDPLLEPWPVVIPPVEVEAVAYRILDNPGGVDWSSSGSGSGEYFLVENRQLLGYDEEMFTTAGEQGEGLLIFHVDESQPHNNGTHRLLVSVVQADGAPPDQIGTGGVDDLWKVGREFTPWTTPSSQLYGGTFTGISITQIYNAGTDRMGATLSRGEILPGEEMYVFPNPWVMEEGPERLTITFAHSLDGDPGTRIRRLKAWIYDLSGGLVRVLDDPLEAPTTGHRAYWDGRNEEGDLVAAGVYFLLVDNGWTQSTGNIAVVR